MAAKLSAKYIVVLLISYLISGTTISSVHALSTDRKLRTESAAINPIEAEVACYLPGFKLSFTGTTYFSNPSPDIESVNLAIYYTVVTQNGTQEYSLPLLGLKLNDTFYTATVLTVTPSCPIGSITVTKVFFSLNWVGGGMSPLTQVTLNSAAGFNPNFQFGPNAVSPANGQPLSLGKITLSEVGPE